MASEEEIRRQLIDAYEGVDDIHQVNDLAEIVIALRDGIKTEFSSGEFSITAMELDIQTDEYRDPPYYDVHSLLDDTIRGLKVEFPEHFTSDFSYCPSCGESLSGSPSFCKYCGQELSED